MTATREPDWLDRLLFGGDRPLTSEESEESHSPAPSGTPATPGEGSAPTPGEGSAPTPPHASRRPRFVAGPGPSHVRGGGRLPAPGQVIDLDDQAPLDTPFTPPVATGTANPPPEGDTNTPNPEPDSDIAGDSQHEPEDIVKQPTPTSRRKRLTSWLTSRLEAAEERLGIRDPGDSHDDQDTGHGEDTEQAGPAPPATPTRRRPHFTAPGVPHRERRSLIDWYHSIPPHTRWLTYHGTGLAAGAAWGAYGWWFFSPQWATAEVEYLATTQDTWHTGDCLAYYVIVAAIVAADIYTRKRVLPIAWATRALTASLVIGTLLYGNAS